ncbi:Sdf4 protein [Gryllus bimaculatus]|nr:Sdf4 protein [Gryllus bimaculatus]
MAVFIRLVQAARTFGYVSCQRWSLALLFLLYGCLLLLTWALSWPLRSQPPKLIPSAQVKKEVDTGNVPDHLEAVRIERDGEINKEFHKEVVVGDLSPNVKKEDPKILLETIFNKADTNNDHLLSLSELSTWISAKIQEHIKQALDENFGLFTSIDNNPRNGVVSWDEYHSYFLKQKGLNDKYVENHDKKHKDLDRALKEAIMRDRASWSEAARNDPDHLTLDEFLAFRHPESSHATILTLLTEEEFASLPTEPDNEEDGERMRQGEAERRREFREVIDVDKNGKADRKELLMYIDPRNPRHAREEAETLLSLSDVDGDQHLSLGEVLNKMDLFLGSKMVDTARSFHDEF